MKAIRDILHDLRTAVVEYDDTVPFPDVLEEIERARRKMILEHLPEEVVGTQEMHEILIAFSPESEPIAFNTLKHHVRHEEFPGRKRKEGRIVFDPRKVLEWHWAGRPAPWRKSKQTKLEV